MTEGTGARSGRWFACDEHAEWVLDDWVEEFRSAPSIDAISSAGPARCRVCGRPADRVFFLEEEDSTGAPADSGSG